MSAIIDIRDAADPGTDAFVRIGTVAVDSGSVMVSDPCYAAELAAEFFAMNRSGVQQLKPGNPEWTESLGIAAPSCDGDGVYPVYARFGPSRLNPGHRTVLALVVNFEEGGAVDALLGKSAAKIDAVSGIAISGQSAIS